MILLKHKLSRLHKWARNHCKSTWNNLTLVIMKFVLLTSISDAGYYVVLVEWISLYYTGMIAEKENLRIKFWI